MISILTTYWPDFVEGLKYTLSASVLALIGSLIIGLIFALFVINPLKPLRVIGRIYIEIFRNIPLLVVAMFFYIVMPQFIPHLDGFTAGTIGLIIYTSAFIAETIRAGIESVDLGQMEAARSNGMSYIQAMRYIVLPQALKIVIPPLGNQFVNLVKNSSVLAFLAGFDLMYQGNLIASTTFKTTDTYLAVGLLYLILTMPLSYLMRYLEKHWSTGAAE
ncbi:amino acid ABC transporter permease [Lapidilactobacillus wuchangensis]|uniref:amino acid ABC transporter permease n=1 Tax=Lapidilactobacillus wuchangensis TaxID=2486001 RepID=UPI000F776411|nr:amino acid ABC transporter permease [Lapidilactobacillus wuchangensis]